GGDVLRLAEAAERGELGQMLDDLPRLALQEQVPSSRAPRDRVHGDSAPAELLGKDARHRLDGRLCGGIYAVGWLEEADDARREGGDGAAAADPRRRLAPRVYE